MPDWQLEENLWQQGYSPVAGVDEAGRGALAGPVVAAAVILPVTTYPYDDSKKLTALKREQLSMQIKQQALAWAVGYASPQEIDTHNVLKATHIAAQRALAHLNVQYAALVTDYLKLTTACPVLAVAKGDALSYQIAAASILAKTERDAFMVQLDAAYPGYAFKQHKGYGTATHLNALQTLGPTDVHRYSFAPVAQQRLFN